LKAVRLLKELAKTRFPGPSPAFTELHLFKAIEVIGEMGVVGRKRLSMMLRVGEGAVRTMLSRLEGANLIQVSRAGCRLTSKGREIYQELRWKFARMAPVQPSPITVGACNFGIIVKDAGHKVRLGVEQRDAAIRAGASGATTLVYRDRKLVIPAITEDALRDYPEIARQIIAIFQPEENDVVVVGSGNTEEEAEAGAAEKQYMSLHAQ